MLPRARTLKSPIRAPKRGNKLFTSDNICFVLFNDQENDQSVSGNSIFGNQAGFLQGRPPMCARRNRLGAGLTSRALLPTFRSLVPCWLPVCLIMLDKFAQLAERTVEFRQCRKQS